MKIELGLEDLSGLLGQTATELETELVEGEGEEKKLKSNALKIVKSKFSERFKGIEKEAKDEGIGQATRKILTEKEKEIAKKFKVEKGTIAEMFQSVIDKSEENKKSGVVTLDDIKNSEHLETLLKPHIDSKLKLEADLKAAQSDLNLFKRKGEVKSRLNPLFNEYVVTKDKHKTSVENAMLRYEIDWEKQTAKLDGKIVKDENLIPKTPTMLFHETASEWLDKKQPEEKKTPGTQAKKVKATPPSGGKKPGQTYESKDAYMKSLRSAQTLEERNEIKQNWADQQSEN